MDKPTELKPLSDEKAKEIADRKAGKEGSDIPDPPPATTSREEEIRKSYLDYRDKVIGDKVPTAEQMSVLHGIADRLLDDEVD